jgi:tetratricopeptide (TPR) repeat protein
MSWVTEAHQLHERGRQLVGAQDFQSALKAYQACVTRLKQPDALQDSTAQDGDHTKLLTTALANAALCWMKLGKWLEAEEACTHCLEIDPKSSKARGRRGLARSRLAAQGDLQYVEGAEADLKSALQVDPQDTFLQKAFEQIEGMKTGGVNSRLSGGSFSFAKALRATDKRSTAPGAPGAAEAGPVHTAPFGYDLWQKARLAWMGITPKEEQQLPDDLSSQESWDEDDDEALSAEDIAVRRVLEAKCHFPAMPGTMPLGRVMRVARRLWDE